MSVYVQTNQNIIVPNAAAFTVNAADTGKIFILPQTTVGVGAITVTLPALAAGLHYRFINGSAGASVATVAITATAAVLQGQAVMGPVGGVSLLPISANTTLNFVNAVTLKGDYADYYCDGTNWYVIANARTSGSFTVA